MRLADGPRPLLSEHTARLREMLLPIDGSGKPAAAQGKAPRSGSKARGELKSS
jgi:hypothetical protein